MSGWDYLWIFLLCVGAWIVSALVVLRLVLRSFRSQMGGLLPTTRAGSGKQPARSVLSTSKQPAGGGEVPFPGAGL